LGTSGENLIVMARAIIWPKKLLRSEGTNAIDRVNGFAGSGNFKVFLGRKDDLQGVERIFRQGQPLLRRPDGCNITTPHS
jgi:hypothetical protein